MNQVILIGRLTRDPEIRYIPGSGTPVATFSVAIDRDYVKKDGTKETDFIPVEVMGKTAEFCANYLSKGRLVSVVGSIRIDKYKTQSGENKSFTKVAGKNVKALDSNRNNSQNSQNNFEEPPTFEPSFEPNGLDPNGFQAIDDEDIPF